MNVCVFEKRPWGWMLKLIHAHRFWIKLIRVTGRTSLQTHEHRSEYHISIKGVRHIARREKHRMVRGWYVELAFGTPAENDIIRYEDDYGRAH